MYKEICFKTAEVFKPDDILSHWIINLALIRNDLLYSNEYAFNHFEREAAVENGRFINYLRITLSHYIAAMKFLAEYHSEPEIIDFIETLDTQNKEKYSGILSNVIPYDNSFVKNQCEPLVGATMHYTDNQEDINKYLASYQEGTIVIKGDNIRLVDLEFADDCATYLSFTHLHSGETEAFCKEIGNKFLELMSFIEEVIPVYLSQKMTTS
ncbi:hypothetical protein SPSYN_02906 [Sporotomaculum syntrophicum]|uniref:Uncharacterized protein n=1 Tax=Sporotomaculum syntrophicum TaxID=182264 RepID=A0A9D2WMH4_9FIRM|nr:hypothetical protein [Sporotomaculum syntrophicum]KAF1083994.1 hypothetical protein SPSYN_02906 [Sporotomaculum syntrophicum]